MLNIYTLKCLQDNYSYVLEETNSKLVAVVDPSEFNPIDKFINDKFKKIDFILNTHHHYDHTGGNIDLKKKYNCKIIGSKVDINRIPGIDIALGNNDDFGFGEVNFKIILVPGHTLGHICYFFEKEKIIFTGDTLFSLGCGRVFEGTYSEMLNSLNKIKRLPKETKIYCGHEYTKKNLEFCCQYENNDFLNNKKNWIDSRIKNKLPTIPTTIEDELNSNIFLRCNEESVKKSLGMINAKELDIFKKLRDLKDSF